MWQVLGAFAVSRTSMADRSGVSGLLFVEFPQPAAV